MPGIGQHLEEVGDADRRDHHRQQEDDAEKPAAGQLQGGQDRQSQPQPVLEDEPDEDVGQGHEERPGPATLGEDGLDEEPRQPEGGQAADGTKDESDRPRPAPDRPPVAPGERRGDRGEDRPAEDRRRLEEAHEMDLLASEQEHLVVVETGEPDIDAVRGELEPRQG